MTDLNTAPPLKVDIDVAHRHVVDLLPTELVTRIPITSTQIGRLHHRCDVRRPRWCYARPRGWPRSRITLSLSVDAYLGMKLILAVMFLVTRCRPSCGGHRQLEHIDIKYSLSNRFFFFTILPPSLLFFISFFLLFLCYEHNGKLAVQNRSMGPTSVNQNEAKKRKKTVSNSQGSQQQ